MNKIRDTLARNVKRYYCLLLLLYLRWAGTGTPQRILFLWWTLKLSRLFSFFTFFWWGGGGRDDHNVRPGIWSKARMFFSRTRSLLCNDKLSNSQTIFISKKQKQKKVRWLLINDLVCKNVTGLEDYFFI